MTGPVQPSQPFQPVHRRSRRCHFRAPTPPPAPGPVVPAKPPRSGQTLWINVALGLALAVALGGVAFAAGRMTAPATAAANGNGNGRFFGNGGYFPGGGNGNGGTFPGGGLGNRGFGGGGLSVEGTVTAMTADSITITTATGQIGHDRNHRNHDLPSAIDRRGERRQDRRQGRSSSSGFAGARASGQPLDHGTDRQRHHRRPVTWRTEQRHAPARSSRMTRDSRASSGACWRTTATWSRSPMTARPASSSPVDRRHRVLILDIGLPDISGLDVARRVRKAGGEMAILMLTARDTVERPRHRP